ncbi:uncharacterized protein LOC131879620 [Tigriopus californicus]|uniref:uncharacterized protein LOC131879620 n=1 Tax=Tigriopus californicus TaxID=6832 RepID=UPI0027D9F3F9|nr:uncharacterized protein LOC131879620 [Tigriopus californicus]
MGLLPVERSSFSQVCFQTVGLDFFGPLFVKHICSETSCPHQVQSSKVYGCIFTCFTSRAIHLELVVNLTTATFLLAFRRFMSRRGIPQTCYSDNAKTFKGADKELRRIFKTINWDHAQESMSRFKITFEFSTANAPWTNGITERMVGLTKKVLRIALHATTLTTRELETVLFECEAIVNNRPLASVTEGDLLLPVTPAQLCVGRDLLHLPDPGRIKGQEEPQFVAKWRQRMMLVNSFWRRWRNDYLMCLAPTKKWTKKDESPLSIGDVVLLRDDHLGRNEWKMARVENLHRGRDNLIRSADLRLPSRSIVRRHINRLALLEENMS